MKIDKTAVLGAGAVGAAVLDQLEQAGSSVSVIADGERAQRYRRNGLSVNGRVIRPAVADCGPFQLIFIAVKSYHLEEAVKLLEPCVGEQTFLMSLLNGIGSEDLLGRKFGHERVVPAMILGIDAQRNETGVRYTNKGVIHYGVNPESPSQNLEELDEWLSSSGLACSKSDDITRSLWQKFMINVGANQASALYGVTYKGLQKDPEVRKLMFAAMEEVVALSRLEKTGLTEKDIEHWDTVLETMDPDGKTSMAQDLAAGRTMEVDIFAETVVRLAAKHSLDVPVNRMLLEKLGG